MELEVPRRPVGPRRHRQAIALVAAVVGVIAVGAFWPETPSGVLDQADPRTAATAPAEAVPTTDDPGPFEPTIAWAPPPAAASAPVRRSRAWPIRIEPVCRDVEPISCERIALAALDLVLHAGTGRARDGSPRIVSLTIWQSLICGDSLDCPPGRLRDASSLGSAVVRFAGSPGALWVNVVAETTDEQAAVADIGTSTRAWPVRWVP